MRLPMVGTYFPPIGLPERIELVPPVLREEGEELDQERVEVIRHLGLHAGDTLGVIRKAGARFNRHLY